MDKLPIYTEIFGIPHTIEWVDNKKDVSIDFASAWGEVNYESRKIVIFKGISDRDKLLVLFEEILHVVLNEIEMDNREDHKIITPLVNGLFTALEKAGMLKE